MKEKPTLIDKLNKIISAAGQAILMNMLFLVCCLPVVTIGQAWCGLMSSVRYNIRGDKWSDGFKKGFFTRFWRGTIIWIVGLLAFMFFLWDLNAAYATNDMVTLISSGIMCTFVACVVHSALALNVYIYTSVNDWIKNIINLIFKAPLQMILSAALVWGLLPAFFVFFPKDGFVIYLIMELSLVFFCAYFSLAAVLTTMALKGGLTEILLDCRADGLIIAEEGVMPTYEEDADE